MASLTDRAAAAAAFDAVADEYDRHRPAYPEVLVDRACQAAGLSPGMPVLELGCGTGKLTEALLARGLRVTAVEPGLQLIARARARLAGGGEVEFVPARLEAASLPRAHFRAVFAASAIHWIDPAVSWRRVAEALVDGGALALLSYFGLDEPRSAGEQRALRQAMADIAPELAATWPTYRDLASTRAGARERRANVSEVWAWLGGYDVAHPDAGALFGEAELLAVPALQEHTGRQLNALLATMSFWARLSAAQREALSAAHESLHRRLGRPIRSSTAACLVTARRAPRAAAAVDG